MKITILTKVLLTSILAPSTLFACAPTGSVDHNIVNDCPTIFSYDFDPGDPTDVVTSSVLNTSISGGSVVASATNDYGHITTGAYVSDIYASLVKLEFNVASGQTLELEGIQLHDYWTTEPLGVAMWDAISIKLSINNLPIALTGNVGAGYLDGWRGTSDGLSVSNEFWEFATNAPNTASSSTITANSGDLVTIELISASTSGIGRGQNVLGMGGVSIHACTVPEPTSWMLSCLAAVGFTLRRRR